jgi:prepilin-type N-terminal cleavage/methylation domain-containing protein
MIPVEINKNHKGFTLVEVLIVSAIMGVMVLGLMQIMSWQQRVNKTGEVNAELVDVKNFIQGWLYNKPICDATLRGRSNSDTVPIDAIYRRRFPTPEKVIDIGDALPGKQWAVAGITLLSRSAAQALFPTYNVSIDTTNGVGDIILRFTIRQIRAGTTNVVAGQERSNFASVEKLLYFNLQGRFAKDFPVMVGNDSPNPTYFQDLPLSSQPNLCGPNATTNENNTSMTMLSAMQSTCCGDATADNTGFVLRGGTGIEQVFSPSLGAFSHVTLCQGFHVDAPIAECLPPGSNLGL